MLLLKALHIACAVLWLGNFVVTGIWSVRAYVSANPELRTFAAREIIFTDAVFTLIFGAAVTISGIVLARLESIDIMRTLWARTALEIVIVAGIAWLIVLLPIEVQMYKRAQQRRAFRSLFILWNATGWLVTVALFFVIYLMVVKPA